MARDTIRVRAATRAPTPPKPGAIAAAGTELSSGVVLTSLKELPPPTGADSASRQTADAWQSFFDYALAQSGATDQLQSALLAPGATFTPERRGCPAAHPAVVLDLDPQQAPFTPDQVVTPPAELVSGLQSLRQAGIIVLWISQLPAARVADVAKALRTSGLDPEQRDQLLLIRNADDRKQVLREQANRDVCIVAIAGDRRSDFDELFDYLRNPAAGVGLYPMMGDGWFLVPAPLNPTESIEPEISAPADPSAGPD